VQRGRAPGPLQHEGEGLAIRREAERPTEALADLFDPEKIIDIEPPGHACELRSDLCATCPSPQGSGAS
jgi:hypothetical protein